VTENILGNCRLWQLHARGDERGSLIALQGGIDVPFDIARVYYVFGTKPGVDRGFHAHRNLRQLAICVSGSCVMILDDGSERVSIRLDSPEIGLEIGPMIWREMTDFSQDAVLLVLASSHYDPSDYLKDYAEFVALAKVGMPE
jgi:dTDP-4-dehydrorhamnose 3,5-epimerase-like enzyme